MLGSQWNCMKNNPGIRFSRNKGVNYWKFYIQAEMLKQDRVPCDLFFFLKDSFIRQENSPIFFLPYSNNAVWFNIWEKRLWSFQYIVNFRSYKTERGGKGRVLTEPSSRTLKAPPRRLLRAWATQVNVRSGPNPGSLRTGVLHNTHPRAPVNHQELTSVQAGEHKPALPQGAAATLGLQGSYLRTTACYMLYQPTYLLID